MRCDARRERRSSCVEVPRGVTDATRPGITSACQRLIACVKHEVSMRELQRFNLMTSLAGTLINYSTWDTQFVQR